MAYLPMADYRFALPKMNKFRNPSSPWVKYQSEKCGHLLKPVLNRIHKEGPLGARDFALPPGHKGGTWWDWKPAKVALELLFWQGKLMISKREKFQKVYDLTERVIPNHIETTPPTEEELGVFLANRALRAMGIASEKDIRRFLQAESARDSDMQIASRELISRSLNQLIVNGEVIPINLENDKSSLYYVHSNTLDKINSQKSPNRNVFLLSPFDNLIIQRDRLKRIFDFEYALECYLPPTKRTFGYFTLPILWGNNFVGKIDPKADRKNKTLLINNLLLEQSVEESDDFLSSLGKSIAEFTRFNQCESVKIVKLSPAKLKPVLNRMIKKFLVSNK